MTEYRTIRRESCTELTVKRSRFLGSAFPVQTEEEVRALLEKRKKEFWDASHHCYAYALLTGEKRFSDDGEPQGTAGKPILSVLENGKITNCLLIVTRYFGGVLLGTGGLVHAYGSAAGAAAQAAEPIRMQPVMRSRFTCEYHQYGRLSALVAEQDGQILDTDFSDRTTVSFLLPAENAAAFQKKLCEESSGRVLLEILGEGYREKTEK